MFSSSPPVKPKQIAGSTLYLRRGHTSMPPLGLCMQMNANIRADPILDSPYFDLAGHLRNRAYCMHNVGYASGTDETAALLDISVKDLLPSPIPPPRAACPSGVTFAIQPSEDGKNGLGMFAKHDIPAGGLVVVERPVVVTPYVLAFQDHPESALYAALLRRLALKTASGFMALANCKPAAECDEVEGIVRTNGIPIRLNVPATPHSELATHRAVFLNTSRCNHSCSPNAAWHWDPTSFSLALEAVRPIPAGHEITVAYVSPTYSRAERRARLKEKYNFSCRCPTCALPAALVSKSDATRAELRAFSDGGAPSFEAWCMDERMPDDALIGIHTRAVALIEGEGLQVLQREYGRHLDALAMGYGALGDVERFREWARKARDCRPMGGDNAAVTVLQGWIEEPETFPVWGLRKLLKD